MSMAAYDTIAGWYEEYITSGAQGLLYDDLVLPAMFELMGEVQGQRVVDIACGQGVVTRKLARSGAQAVGIDISEKLLAMARKQEDAEGLGMIYQQDDACSLSTLEDEGFDGAVCNMALMDISDLQAAFQAVRRVVRPDGWFIFSITHPCFQTPHSKWVEEGNGVAYQLVRGYFEEGFWRSDNPLGVRSRVGAQHRMLSTYLNLLLGCGFAIESMVEPRAQGRLAEAVPEYKEAPPVLVVRGRRV